MSTGVNQPGRLTDTLFCLYVLAKRAVKVGTDAQNNPGETWTTGA